MRKRLLAGNWKMNKSIAELSSFFESFSKELANEKRENVEVLFAAPYLQLAEANKLASSLGIKIASQNVHFEESGAYTGEVSIGMLKEIGVNATLIGHSERRQYFGETDESVSKKVEVCLKSGMTPIACVGETKEDRESNKTEEVLKTQIDAIISKLDDIGDLVVAYEPVWAIGTGLTASNEQAQQAHAFIRSLFTEKYGKEVSSKLRILYGGSAKPSNIEGLLEQPDIDGGLVGGASLKPADFAEMVKKAL